jgi:HEPN domain-containing protein
MEDLAARGLIEAVAPDRPMAEQWINDARRHLQAAQAIEVIDPSGSYVLAYDAARKSVAAVLLMTGYRIRGGPGSQQALALFAKILADESGESALEHVDRLRRNRNRSEYGSRTFGAGEVREAIHAASLILEACSGRIEIDHPE